jgi:nucleoside-diphosphate-sugar epimerase
MMICAIEKKDQLPPELILVIGEDRTASYQTLQNRISEILNHKDFEVFRVPKWVAKEGAELQKHLPFVTDDFIQPWMIDIADDHYALDITRARKTIDWNPKHFVLDDLPTMMELLKKDPLAWYKTNELKPPKWLLAKV